MASDTGTAETEDILPGGPGGKLDTLLEALSLAGLMIGPRERVAAARLVIRAQMDARIKAAEEGAAAGDEARRGLQLRLLGSIRLEVDERGAGDLACGAPQVHHLGCGGGIVPSRDAHAQGPLVMTELAVQNLLALAACSRAVSRLRPCDGGKRSCNL